MKKIITFALSLFLMLGATSCENWLDVNVSPDSPNNEDVTVSVRLPWIQYYYMYGYGNASVRIAGGAAQMITGTSRSNAISSAARWEGSTSLSTTPYQNWFIGAACNIPDIIKRAEKEGAYHYIGAAYILKSMGYIMMADLYGEMPYSGAVTGDLSPEYDNGEDIYNGCLADLEKGIEYLQKTQEIGAPTLAEGDAWNGGDTGKWIKLAYGLKARWLGNLSKTDKYDPQAILDAIAKGPQSNADNTDMTHYNVETADKCITVGDAYGPCVIWDVAAWGSGQRLNKYYVDLLTDFRGSGVEDPRADKLLPHAMYKVELNKEKSKIIKHEWLRDCGVNLHGADEGWLKDRYTGGNLNLRLTLCMADDTKEYTKAAIKLFYKDVDAFLAVFEDYYSENNVTIDANAKNAKGEDVVKVTYHPGAMYVNDSNPLYVEDIKYVQLQSDAVFETNGLSKTDMCCYRTVDPIPSRALGYVQGTGTFYARPDSDTDILTYTEMCFLKAEVLFRQGDKDGAYRAYRDGIKSHFERMNVKLAEWKGKGCDKTERDFNISMSIDPMAQEDIDAYMESDAVAQSAAELDMADIMLQKLIGMGFNYQNYNDVRRFNFAAGNIKDFGVVYEGMTRPSYFTGSNGTFSTDPQSDMYYMRRIMHCSHETGYNATNCNASVEQYSQYGVSSAKSREIWSIPVWWDWTK